MSLILKWRLPTQGLVEVRKLMVETDLNEVVTLAREAFPGDYPLSNSAAVGVQFFLCRRVFGIMPGELSGVVPARRDRADRCC
jgi:hypothetical protein